MLDDEDAPNIDRTAADEGHMDEDGAEDLAPDFRLFEAMLKKKKGYSGTSIRKGEKDFEQHGTQAQSNSLEHSRQVMEEIQSYERFHKYETWNRGWFFPKYWSSSLEEKVKDTSKLKELGKDDLFLQNRVVVVEMFSGTLQKSIGRTIPGVTKFHPAFGKSWLLPEEALFLVERGNLDLWYPSRPIEDLMPGWPREIAEQRGNNEKPFPQSRPDPSDYEKGTPLSLQAAYAMLVGEDGEECKVSLRKYQVYAHLKRAGFHVFPAWEEDENDGAQPWTLWSWMTSLLDTSDYSKSQNGSLVGPGVYHSYKSVYSRLQQIPRHVPTKTLENKKAAEQPFKVDYFVWKADGAPFTKGNPRAPDFRVCVVDAKDTMVPTLDQVTALLETTPYSPPSESWQGPGRMHQRLKHGYRNVLIAVVDCGIISFSRFCETAFALEDQTPRFDISRSVKGRKNGGGRGRGRGRGRGGRGRGRGG
ncbi:hypothetical protein BROUX41_000452 [Berkeleyomyces rouxiae]|uniref:uncharacterized protein n=1 Tax=Berkeleyomyces rouxiae TaxID=2035830 RepID=UPI003B7F7809